MRRFSTGQNDQNLRKMHPINILRQHHRSGHTNRFNCHFAIYRESSLMKLPETVFAIPTYRLRDVSETIEAYDEHFWTNGHSAKMIVFDDSSFANHEKYFPELEKTKTVNDLYYLGPREKEQY